MIISLEIIRLGHEDSMEDKRPNALTHGIYPNSPASLSPIPIQEWKATIAPVLRHYFQAESDELIWKYEQLVEKFNVNRMVYESSINFEPVIGQTYYLYERENGMRFLSLVEPEYSGWSGFIGRYRLSAQFAWEEVK